MNRLWSLLLKLALLLIASSAAHAQLFRAYVASYGSDSNPCVLTAPCRLVPAALNAVASGGEIWMLDSANYNAGTVDINKSVSILAIPGAVGSIVAVAGSPAITIQTSGVVVTLRNVVIANNAANPGIYGINMTNGGPLTVEGCVLQGLQQAAIYAGGNPVIVYVKDSEIRNGESAAVWAYDGATVDIIRTKMTNNYLGGVLVRPSTATGVSQATVTDSLVSGRLGSGTSVGLDAFATVAGSVAKIFANRMSISSVTYGLLTTGSGTSSIEIGSSMVVRNQNNINVSGGQIRSLGNNHISDPIGTDVGSLTVLAPR